MKLTKPLIILAILGLLLILLRLYQGDYLIFGGEGNYFIDPGAVMDMYRSTWGPQATGVGAPNPLVHQTLVIFDFWVLLEQLGLSQQLINLITVFLMYTLPFLSMFAMLHIFLKSKFWLSLMVSLFYLVNPFTVSHVQFMMFWNIAPLFVLPIVFGIVYRFFDRFWLMLSVFGLFIAVVPFAFENIPMLVIFQMFLPLAVILVSVLKKSRLEIKRVILNYIGLVISFVLVSAWWLAPLIRYKLEDTGSKFLTYTVDESIQYVQGAIGDGMILNKLFTFKTLIHLTPDNFISWYYHHPVVHLWLFIPWILLIHLLIYAKKAARIKLFAGILILTVILFLNKGANAPAGEIYGWLITNLPLFFILKSPLEKFSVLTIFFFSVCLYLALDSFSGRKFKKKFLYGLLILYIVISAVPYLTLNFHANYDLEEGRYMSRRYIDKQSYQEARNLLSSDGLIYRVLSLYPGQNYQVTMLIEGNKYYRGMDHFVFGTNKSFMVPYFGSEADLIYENLDDENLAQLMAYYNVAKIMVNDDIRDRPEEMVNRAHLLFSSQMDRWESGPIKIYENNTFLPLFYTPEKILVIDGTTDILDILEQNKLSVRSAVFYANQNEDIEIEKMLINKQKNRNLPIIEFKQINYAKYRVLVRRASDVFPLVFSTSYHPRWQVYFPDNSNYVREFYDYDHQELERFVSDNIMGTIQNDNLSDGVFWETWGMKTIGEGNHLLANGYANAWVIDSREHCKLNISCVNNEDGSYDFELVLEFSAQRFLYVGILMSTLAVLACLGYLWRLKKAQK